MSFPGEPSQERRRERITARVLLLDPQGRILLMKGRLPGGAVGSGGWFTLGGGIEPGESPRAAAAREIVEETGFTDARIGELAWRAQQTLHDRKGRPVLFRESYFFARCAGGEPSRAGWQALENEFVDDIRWWSAADLAACADRVFPPDLPERLARFLAEQP